LAIGTFASLVALIFSNIGSAASRGSPILNSGPFSITTIMLASAVPVILSHTNSDLNDSATITLVIELVFFTVFMSGLFQIFFGLVKIGSLAKYIPYPVIAGLMNGAGIAIVFSQIRPLTGIGKETSLNNFSAILHNLSLPSLCVGALALLLFWQGDKISRWLPIPFFERASPASDVNRRKAPRIPPHFSGSSAVA
jgi:MFS superfamily sulfate permease-like transporter